MSIAIIIQTIICAVLFLYALRLVLLHNMHMFQLNGYKNGEHLNRLKKNLRQQWLLIFTLALGLLRLIFPVLILDILGWLKIGRAHV